MCKWSVAVKVQECRMAHLNMQARDARMTEKVKQSEPEEAVMFTY
jgi:hypothetical protein